MGLESDQLLIYIDNDVPQIAREYLDALTMKFDEDGINDRQLEYKRTIQFVDSRSSILKEDLLSVENRKQIFKEENNISDISSDANLNIEQKIVYNSELFNAKSQLELVKLLEKMRDDGMSVVDVDAESENRYAEHCRQADIASAPLRDCISYYNGEGEADPGSLAYYGGREWHKIRREAEETLNPYIFES